MADSDIRRALFLREMGITPWQLRGGAAAAQHAEADCGSPATGTQVGSVHGAEDGPDPATVIEAGMATERPAPMRADAQGDAGARRGRIAGLDWESLVQDVAECTACDLCRTRKQTVFGVGVRDARWMLVGEAPGAEEDARGEPFVGQAGRLLDAMLAASGLARTRNVFIANVLKCRPPGNRDPLLAEVSACEPYLLRQLELVDPDIVVVLGRFAAQSLLATDASIARLRGRAHAIEVRGRQVPVIVTYHPAYLLRTLSDKAKAWSDWCLAADTLAALPARS